MDPKAGLDALGGGMILPFPAISSFGALSRNTKLFECGVYFGFLMAEL